MISQIHFKIVYNTEQKRKPTAKMEIQEISTKNAKLTEVPTDGQWQFNDKCKHFLFFFNSHKIPAFINYL